MDGKHDRNRVEKNIEFDIPSFESLIQYSQYLKQIKMYSNWFLAVSRLEKYKRELLNITLN